MAVAVVRMADNACVLGSHTTYASQCDVASAGAVDGRPAIVEPKAEIVLTENAAATHAGDVDVAVNRRYDRTGKTKPYAHVAGVGAAAQARHRDRSGANGFHRRAKDLNTVVVVARAREALTAQRDITPSRI